MDAAAIVKEWGWIGAAATAAAALFKTWWDSRSAKRRDENEMFRIAQEAASDGIGDLRDIIETHRQELSQLRGRVRELETELTEARREHAEATAAKDAKIALLEGEVRHWISIAQSYEHQLTEAGIPHAKPARPFWAVPAAGAPLVDPPEGEG